MDRDNLHHLSSVGKLIESDALAHRQFDVEIKPCLAHGQVEVASGDLFASRLNSLSNSLDQRRCVACPITFGYSRRFNFLLGPPIRLSNTIVAKMDVRSVPRKIVCHYNLCCR